MKKIYYLFVAAVLTSCHPPEFTTVEINATDVITGNPSNGYTCFIEEGGLDIAHASIINGTTKVAFDTRSNRSYDIRISSDDGEPFKIVNNPYLGVDRGQATMHQIQLASYGTLDLGLQAQHPMSLVTDYLEYQIVSTTHNDVAHISNGWNYNDPDIMGEVHNDHYANYNLPAGSYRLNWRVKRSGYNYSGQETIEVSGKDTTNFVLEY